MIMKHIATKHKQEGVALIVVLLVLVLIIIAGAIAVRQSTTDLKIATADQVNKLLFQANDAAFMKVEKEDRILSSSRENVDVLKGYMSNSERAGHEVSLCVRPRSTRLFSILEISELNEDGDLLLNKANGYCDPSNDDDYVSEGRVITQLSFVRPAENTSGVFGNEGVNNSSNDTNNGSSGNQSMLGCTTFQGYATSIIPALSNATLGNERSTGTDSIAGCLKQPRVGTTTVDTCLSALGVPYQTHVQQYVNEPTGVKCLNIS